MRQIRHNATFFAFSRDVARHLNDRSSPPDLARPSFSPAHMTHGRLRSMLSRVHSFILFGIDALLCEVEVDVAAHGLEKTTVVGLAQTAVKESIDRVHRPILN